MNTIGLPQAIALYIAAVIGSGILFLSGATASVAGPASIIAWIMIIIFSFPIAYTFAVLSREYPDAGGASTFVQQAFNRSLGGLVGWFYFFCATSGQVIVSLTGAYYLAAAFQLSNMYVLGFAVIMLISAGVFNYLGMQVSAGFSIILSSILVSLLLIAIGFSIPHVELHHFSPFAPFGWKEIGTAITMMFWLFFGWEAICNLSDRFKKPKTDIVKSTLISASIISVLALSLSFVTIGTNTYGQEEQNLSPIGIMMGNYIGGGAQFITGVLAFIICLGTVNAFIASLSNLGYALSREGDFPSFFHYKHVKTNSPTRVIVLVVGLSIAGVTICVTQNISYDQLLFIPNSLGLTVYILSMGAGIKLLKKKGFAKPIAILAFILCMICIPFFGQYYIVPLIVMVMYGLFRGKFILLGRRGVKE